MNKRTLHVTLSIALVAASLLACVWPKPKVSTPTSAPTATAEATIVSKVTVAPSSTATFSPTATPTSSPTPTPSPTPMPPTAPILISHQPDRGEELQVDAPLVLTFDQAMDQGSVENAFGLQPTVAGQLKWASDRVLMFEPEKPWQRESAYRVAIDASAQSKEGLALRDEVSFRFTTTGYLEVTEVQPAADTTEVIMGSTVTVMFNRPVVPLGPLSDASKLPQPLTFVPAVEGQGEWLNTSIYVWRPKSGLLPSTTYKVTVKSGLRDTTGGILDQDYTWSFTTEMPRVLAVSPADEFAFVGPSQAITVTFNQPMDAGSVEDKFSLADGKGKRVAGKFSWSNNGTSLTFAPAAPLPRQTSFVARVDQGARGATGSQGTQKAYEWWFTTVGEPRVVTINPSDGATNVSPYTEVYVKFGAPMAIDTLLDNLRIEYADPNARESGTITPTQVYSYWYSYDTEVTLSFALRASSQFTVTLGTGLKDKYGKQIAQGAVSRFSTRQLEPSAYFTMPGVGGTFNAYTTTTMIVAYRNISRLEFGLYELPVDEYMSATSDWDVRQNLTTDRLSRVNAWAVDVAGPLNKTEVRRLAVLGPGGGSPAPGYYYLEVRAPEVKYGKNVKPAGYLLSISKSNVVIKRTLTSAMVWVTDLQSGQPVSGATVRLVAPQDESSDKGNGTTDGDGIFAVTFPESNMWQGMFALVTREGDTAVGYTEWSDGISTWEFGIESRYYVDPYSILMYTERPIYRPGQTVYFKGIFRVDDDAHYRLPPADSSVRVTVQDAEGREIYSDTLKVSDMGTFYGELELGGEASLGYYSISAMYEELSYGTSFRVAEYRKPEYQVEVQTDQAQYVQGDTINVTALATYYFGGPVGEAKVRWAVLSGDYSFTWDGPGWYDWSEWEWVAYAQEGAYYGGYGRLIAEGTGETDKDGRFTFSVPADIAKQVGSQVFTVEATVTDVNNQEVSSRTQAVVHKGLFYIGLAPKRYVGKVGEELAVEVKAIDLEHAPVANQDVQVVFMTRNWYSVQKEGTDGRWYWEWEVEDKPVFTTTVKTNAKGDAEARFTPKEGGSYKVRATATDSRGNEVRSATYMWVSSSEWVSWRRENNDRIELIADKKEYNVGDTAEILVPSPFQGPVKALLTVERGSVIEHKVFTLQGNSEVVHIPIVEGYVPNVFVSLVLVKGMDDSNPLSAIKVGYVQLPVSTETKTLTVTLTPDRSAADGEYYRPQETARYDVQVTDHAGRGVEAELSFDLVDLSVLALTGDERGPSLIDHFYYRRGVGIATSSSLIQSVDRVAAELPLEEGKGGDGAEAGEGLVRTNFVDTAYWNPTVRTDSQGKATLDVVLPDNLTTWRMRARGITADTLVGEARVDVISTLDVLVRTVAPRFFVIGDQATLSVVAHNNTNTDLQATVSLQAQGLQVADGSRTVTIPAKDKVKVDWAVTVQNVEQVVIKAGAQAGSYSDAMEITLPVYTYSTPEVVATAGQLEEAGERLEAVVLPQKLDPAQGELTVQVDPSLAAGMRDGLSYLEHYPYECIEQTVSRWLPNVLTYKALRDLGIDNPDLAAKLPGLVSEGLQRIYSEQRPDGGWGWWLFSESNPFLSAYVVLGLTKAREADLTVDPQVVQNAVAYLQKQLKSPTTMKKGYEYNQQAFVLYVLAEAGLGDQARTIRLMDDRDKLSNFGKAYLAMALGIVDQAGSGRIKTLLSDLSNAAIVSATGAHWEETWVDYWSMNTDTRSTAVIVAALTRLAPKDALLPNAVRWLMVARRSGHWETTQETAWSLIALTDYMVMTGELEADYTYVLSLNGETLEERKIGRQDVGQSVKVEVPIADLLTQEVNQVWVTRNEPSAGQTGKGRLYYAMYLRYFLPVEDVKALSRGIIVARQYTPASCTSKDDCASIDHAKVGDVIRVKITLVAPNDLHYLVLEDPFPAGFEAVDQSLKTTSVVGEEPTLTESDQRYDWGGYGWGWWWFSHSEVRDEKVALFADYLPRGTYEYTYLIRASVPGQFLTMPTVASEMYFPEVWGRSDGTKFGIEPE